MVMNEDDDDDDVEYSNIAKKSFLVKKKTFCTYYFPFFQFSNNIVIDYLLRV